MEDPKTLMFALHMPLVPYQLNMHISFVCD